MAIKLLPFEYGKGAGKQSLLGDVIAGQGAALAASRDTHSMIIRKGAKTAINTITHAVKLAAYGTHFEEYYDAPSVDRHITTLTTGGREVFLDIEEDGMFLNHINPPATWPSHHTQIAAALTAYRWWYLEQCAGMTDENLYRAHSSMAGWITKDFTSGDTEEIFSFTGTAGQVANYLGANTIEDRDHSVTARIARGLYGSNNGVSFIPSNTIAANNLARLCKPGYVNVVMRWHLSGPGQSGNEAGATWRIVVFRRKVSKPSRTAMITFLSYNIQFPNGTSSTIHGYVNTFITSWLAKNSGVSQQLGLTAVQDGAHRFSSVLGTNFGVPSTYTDNSAPSTDASFGSYNDAWTQGYDAWFFPTSATIAAWAQHSGGTVVPYPLNSNSYGAEAFSPRTIPTGLDAWSGYTVTNLAVRIAQYGRTAVPMGCDLTSHPVVGYRAKLESIPALVDLSASMEPQEVIAELCTQMSAADLRAILMAVETHSGESTASMRASLTSDERMFFGIVTDDVIAPPDRNLSLTSAFQIASEAGESILDELIIEKDVDDPDSEAVTFRQADARSKKFREGCLKNKRRGYVIVGPTAAQPITLAAVYAAKISGVMALTKSDFVTLLTPEEIDASYLAIRAGYGINYSAAFKATADFYAYQSEFGYNGYPQMHDAVCMEVFGASYGSITKSTGAQKGGQADTWSSSGQLSGGFLKHPDLWTPEFWLINCASRAWKVETVLGTLLTNPYGVGSLTQKVLDAASGDM